MRLLPRSAAQRIALIGFLAYALATLLLGVAVIVATHAAFTRQIDAGIAQASQSLALEYRDDGLAGLDEAIAELHGTGPVALMAAVFAPDGRRIAGNLTARMPAPGWRQIQFETPREGTDRARAKVSVLADGHRLVVAADLEALETIDRTLLGMFALAFLALLVLGLGGALMLARYLRQRLGTIESTAAAVIAGDLRPRAAVGPHDDEFDRVAASLNAMLDRIGVLVTNLRQVSADIAHDLRTPLTGLRHRLEALREEPDAAARMALADAAIGKADDLLALFRAILRIAEVEGSAPANGFAVIDLSALVRDLGDTLLPLSEDAGHLLDIEVAPGLAVAGDRELLAQALLNLVENALLHTPAGTRITLTAGQTRRHVAIDVRDNGPGIDATDRQRVRQRFVRLDTARNTPGHGLGLSLVESVAHAHRGALELGDAGPGLVATLLLPRVPMP